ncbi:MAG: hypothetical protein AB7I01_14840 [Gammaproteobacteria bacterium]
MSGLDQIQLSFHAGEDRLLLRVSTTGGEEFRCWLTRRFVRALQPALRQALATRPMEKVPTDATVREALLDFERQAAVVGSDFSTPFRDVVRALPLGAQPLVLTRCQLRAQPDGGLLLALAPEQGQGLDLALAPKLLHSFMALLERTVEAAEWGLPAAPATAMQTTAALN